MIRTILAATAVGAMLTLPAAAQSGPPDAAPPAASVPSTPPSTAPSLPAKPVPDAAPAEHPPAEKPLPEGEEGRFAFNRVQDGFVRLDLRTGQVSVCSRRPVGWTCQVTPDDRGVFENEIARLRGENALLKKDLLSRGLPLPGGVRTDTASSAAEPRKPSAKEAEKDLGLPSDADFDRVFNYVEKAWRRLVEILVNLQRDLKKS